MIALIKRIALALTLTLGIALAAQASYPKHIKVTTDNGAVVTVVALSDNVLKVINQPAGTTRTAGGRASVLDENDPGELLNPDGKGISANLCGLQVSVLRNSGKVIINGGPGKSVTDSGLREFAGGKQKLALDIDATGSFYGAGERGHRLNLRGDTLVMYNQQNYGYTGTDPRISTMNITMPLFLATDGYAIVFDDFGAAKMVLSNPIQYITETPQPVSWYYVNGASSLADVTTALTSLTGRQDLPPLWALGYITSKYGYKTQRETEDIVDSLRAKGYPLDGVVLDLYWYGKEQDMGRLQWDRDQFPDPVDMMQYLRAKGVNVVTITQPYILRDGRAIDNYNDFVGKGIMLADSTGKKEQNVEIWVGEGGMFDVSSPAAREWLTKRYKRLTDMGVGGWWGDLGEPEKHPETALHANGITARNYHNQYGNDWSKIVYDLYKNNYPDRRLMSMMRGGTTGLQRYSVFPWSTDVSRSWGGLEPQVRIMLNSGLSGLGYMGHDVGGFAIDQNHPVDTELYVRWLQLGLFSPMLRTHAQANAEPINYPEVQDIILPLIKERYRWLPYNYTLAYENATKGWPLVRPLNFHSTNPAENYDNISDQFLWGRDVMVAPVMKQGAVDRDIVFPAGSDWVDLNNPTEIFKGGSTVSNYPAPLEKLPLFARQGAFLTFSENNMKHTGNYDPTRLTVEYFPAPAPSESVLFEDDMRTPNPERKGRLITMRGDASGKTVDVTLEANGSYPGARSEKTIKLVIFNQKDKPKNVTINKRNSRFEYDKAKQTVTVSFLWKVFQPVTVTLNR